MTVLVQSLFSSLLSQFWALTTAYPNKQIVQAAVPDGSMSGTYNQSITAASKGAFDLGGSISSSMGGGGGSESFAMAHVS